MAINKFFVSDISRQSLNVIFAFTQVICGYFSELTGMGQSIAKAAGLSKIPAQPAGYTFSIWGAIFLWCIIYAVYQAAPANRNNELLRKIGYFTALAFFSNTLWELVVQLSSINWLSALIIVFILIFSLIAYFKLMFFNLPLNNAQKWIVRPAISLLSGWITVAAFLNIASVISYSSLNSFGLGMTDFSIITVITASIFASCLIIAGLGNAWYAGVVIWGLLGIVAENYSNPSTRSLAVVAASMAVLAIASVIAGKIFYGKKPQKNYSEIVK